MMASVPPSLLPPFSSSSTPTNASTLQSAQDYYGRVVQKSSDLRTSACCSNPSRDRRVRTALKKVHPDVCDKYYGCGSPIPPLLNKSTVLDLGCGTGRDCFVLSQLAGKESRVIGVDATFSQLQVGRAALPWHEKEHVGSAPIEFMEGDISNMQSIVADASVNVVVSNCVLNLALDKEAVFGEIARVMGAGAELLFSDIFASEILDPSLLSDPVLHGECLAGAHYLPQLQEQLSKLGLSTLYIMDSTPVEVHDVELRRKLGETATFTSLTVRAFKGIESQCGNDCQVEYIGDEEHSDFLLDQSTVFCCRGDVKIVSGEVAGILKKSRYAPLFRVQSREPRTKSNVDESHRKCC